MSECPNCKTPHAVDDRYCGQCGHRLSVSDFTESGARTQKSLDLVDVHYNLGLVYFKQGEIDQALATWRKALATDPGNESLLERIAEAEAVQEKGSSS